VPNRRIFVIAKFREFNEAAWQRLIIAYAYALHDQRKREAEKEQKEANAAREEGTA